MAIAFNDNIKISAPKPLDQRYLNTSNVPYIDISEVNTSILFSERYIGLTVNITKEEYWYKDGIGDGDLIFKELEDIYVSGGTLSGSGLILYRSEGQSDIIVEMSGLTDGVVSGMTYGGSVLTLKRTLGLPDLTATIGVSGVTDGVVSGATLNGAQLVLERTLGLPDVTADLSALSGTTSDIYVSGGTLDGAAQLSLARSEGQPDVNIDLSALSGGTIASKEVIKTTTPTVEVLETNINTLFVSSGTTLYNLPASPFEGAEVVFVDESGTAGTNTITLDGGSISIYDLVSTTASIGSDYGSITLVFNGIYWNVTAFV